MSSKLKEAVVSKIIEMIESSLLSKESILDGKSNIRWIGQGTGAIPRNFVTKKRYKGINVLSLWLTKELKQYSSDFWLTYKQAQDLGGTVRKGEKSVQCVFYSKIEKKEKEKVKLGDEDVELTDSFFLMKPFFLFNLDQIDGLNLPVNEIPSRAFTPIESAENLIMASKAIINHGGNSAYYSPSKDEITMPLKEAFTSEENYYATVLHELSHWTGHESRLNRDMSGIFGSESYAKEECCAEFSATMLMAEIGLHEATIELHADYLKSWLDVIKADPDALFKAASKAQKASDFILNFINKSESNDETNAGFELAAA